VLLHRLVAELARVDAVGRAEVDGRAKLGGVRVDRVDLCRSRHLRRLNDGEPHRTQAEDPDRAPLLDRRRLAHGAEAGGDAAAEEADRAQVGASVDLRARDLRDDGVLGEGAARGGDGSSENRAELRRIARQLCAAESRVTCSP
jgi:hypothetical protein